MILTSEQISFIEHIGHMFVFYDRIINEVNTICPDTLSDSGMGRRAYHSILRKKEVLPKYMRLVNNLRMLYIELLKKSKKFNKPPFVILEDVGNKLKDNAKLAASEDREMTDSERDIMTIVENFKYETL